MIPKIERQLPREVVRLASQHQLGMFKQEYPRMPDYHLPYLFSGLFLALLGLYCLLRNDTGAGSVLVITGAFLSLPSLIPFVRICLLWRRFYLYEDGLVTVKRFGTSVVASDAIHWRDIAIIWHEIRHTIDHKPSGSVTMTTTHIYSLQRRDGGLFGEDLIKGKITDEELGQCAERMTLRYLFPEAVSMYQRELPVPFGPLTIHSTGIKYEEKFLPWNLYDSLEIGEALVIRQREQRQVWVKLSLAEIPNPAVLRKLTSHIP